MTSDLAADLASSASALNWAEQDNQLRDMWIGNIAPEEIAQRLGRSVAAIRTRAARLGLPRRVAPGRKPGMQWKRVNENAKNRLIGTGVNEARKETQTDADTARDVKNVPMMRICLMCLNRFPSEGRHNRICPRCKGSAEYNAGSSVPDIFKVDT